MRTANRSCAKRCDENLVQIEFGNERFRVKWVTEVFSGIERSRRGGFAGVVFDLTLPAGQGVEMFDKPFEAAPRVPILIPSRADTVEMARQAIQREARNYLVNHPAGGCRLRQRCTQ